MPQALDRIYGTSDSDRITLLNAVTLMRKVASLRSGASSLQAGAIGYSLRRLRSFLNCRVADEWLDRIQSDRSRDRIILGYIFSPSTDSAESLRNLVTDLFRVANCDGHANSRQVDWLAVFMTFVRLPENAIDCLERQFVDPVGREFAAALDHACIELGITLPLTEEVIHQSYRDAAKELHPDKHPGVSDVEKKALANRFARATEAFEVLTDCFRSGRGSLYGRCVGGERVSVAKPGLAVECFFCDSRLVTLPTGGSGFASVRCRVCASLLLFPKRDAEELLRHTRDKLEAPAPSLPPPVVRPPGEQPDESLSDGGFAIPVLIVLMLLIAAFAINNVGVGVTDRPLARSVAKPKEPVAVPPPRRNVIMPPPARPEPATPLSSSVPPPALGETLSIAMAESRALCRRGEYEQAAQVAKVVLDNNRMAKNQEFEGWKQLMSAYGEAEKKAARRAIMSESRFVRAKAAERLRQADAPLYVIMSTAISRREQALAKEFLERFRGEHEETLQILKQIGQAAEEGADTTDIDRTISYVLWDLASVSEAYGDAMYESAELRQAWRHFDRCAAFTRKAEGASSALAAKAEQRKGRLTAYRITKSP